MKLHVHKSEKAVTMKDINVKIGERRNQDYYYYYCGKNP